MDNINKSYDGEIRSNEETIFPGETTKVWRLTKVKKPPYTAHTSVVESDPNPDPFRSEIIAQAMPSPDSKIMSDPDPNYCEKSYPPLYELVLHYNFTITLSNI